MSTLYAVKEGRVRKVSGMAGGMSSQPDVIVTDDFDVRIGLCEYDSSFGPVMLFAATGYRRLSGSGSFLSGRREATNVKVFPGRVPVGRPAIAYVEGDKSVVQPNMTVPAFAENNKHGDYIVITVQFIRWLLQE